MALLHPWASASLVHTLALVPIPNLALFAIALGHYLDAVTHLNGPRLRQILFIDKTCHHVPVAIASGQAHRVVDDVRLAAKVGHVARARHCGQAARNFGLSTATAGVFIGDPGADVPGGSRVLRIHGLPRGGHARGAHLCDA